MNNDITILIINSIHSQQILNNRKEKLRGKQHQFVGFSICGGLLRRCENIKALTYRTMHISFIKSSFITVIIKSIEIYIMNIQEAKQIKIADYLQSLGYTPVKQQGKSLWYKSPLREETEASFKVNTGRNLWYDFGTGKGATSSLAQGLYGSNYVPYLLGKNSGANATRRPVSFSFSQRASEPSFQHLEVRELTHPALLPYLQERRINIALARAQCKNCTSSTTANLISPSGSRNVAGRL